jgi:hypothetical protein
VTTHNKLVQPGTGRHQEEAKELASNQEETVAGTLKM